MSAPEFTEQNLQDASSPGPVESPEDRAARIENAALINLLRGYMTEARDAREGGPFSRDGEWEANWQAYWSNFDFSNKADWQARERLPEVSNFTERFAAAIREALVQAGQFWITTDPFDSDSKLAPHVDKFVQALLDRSGRNATGQSIGFARVFGDMMKSGALMAIADAVTWDPVRKTVRIDPVDARELYFDPTGRGLYRIRRQEIDSYQLDALAEERDGDGKPIYDVAAIGRLQRAEAAELREARETSQGHTEQINQTPRKPITIDEYLCTILDSEGNSLGNNQLVVLANDQEIIRGPEPNPFDHGRDWIVYAPMISVPFSVYGRTYVENFRMVAQTFNEMTNLILDAVQTTAMNAYEVRRHMFEDETQFDEGISPNKAFYVDEDAPTNLDAIKSIDLGRLPPEALAIWNALEKKLGDAASQSELALGQLPAKGDITAAEINTVSAGAAALTRSIATDTEEGILDPTLELTWLTGLQFADLDPGSEIATAIGPEATAMFTAQRGEFQKRKFRLKAKGITGILARATRVRSLTNAIALVSQSPELFAVFNEEFSLSRTLSGLMRDMGVNLEDIRKTDEERTRDAQRAQAAQQAQAASTASPNPRSNGGSPPRQSGIGDLP